MGSILFKCICSIDEKKLPRGIGDRAQKNDFFILVVHDPIRKLYITEQWNT